MKNSVCRKTAEGSFLTQKNTTEDYKWLGTSNEAIKKSLKVDLWGDPRHI